MMGEKPNSAFHAVVIGRVQGVGFRYSACARAGELRLGGWVRNLDDGSVEVIAEGAAEKLALFEEWLRRGPTGAYVRELLIDRIEPRGRYPRFTIEF